MKNKNKTKLDSKLASEQLIISEQSSQTLTSKPPVDKKITDNKEKKVDKKVKKGKFCHFYYNKKLFY